MQRLLLALGAVALASCGAHVQTSSGADYLRRYDQAQGVAALTEAPTSAMPDGVRQAAAVEPLLRFPARIGIARIEGGRLTPIPDEEMAAFVGVAEQTGGAYGEFLPLNPLVTAMAVPEQSLGAIDGRMGTSAAFSMNRAREAVNAIRIGAARQHMDAVLVYEVFGTSDTAQSALSVGDLTLLGAFLLPGRQVDAVGHAEALLVDVRNAYPYLTASETVTRDGLSTTARARRRAGDMKAKAQLAAVEDLAATLPKAFARLAVELGNLPDSAEEAVLTAAN